MKKSVRLVTAFTVGLPLLLASGAAEASAVCERLQAELVSLPKVVADTAGARKYASAIARQNLQLRGARSELRQLGCSGGSIIVIGGASAETCNSMTDAIGRMERNLQVLEAKRQDFAAGVATRGQRAQLLAALEINGCNGAAAKVMPATTTDTVRTLSSGDRSTLPLGTMPEGGERLQLQPLGGGSGHGNLRTVCVRTCDGGFFPISSGATPLDFRRDQKVCAMMCPQTETELFYQSMSGTAETEQMVSTMTGRPYSVLPNAFAYRTRDRAKNDACGCDLSAYYQEMIRREKALNDDGAPDDPASATRESSVLTIRAPEPAAADDEKPVEAAAQPADIEERVYDPSSRKVRTVGPVFLPEKESAIDLGRQADAGLN